MHRSDMDALLKAWSLHFSVSMIILLIIKIKESALIVAKSFSYVILCYKYIHFSCLLCEMSYCELLGLKSYDFFKSNYINTFYIDILFVESEVRFQGQHCLKFNHLILKTWSLNFILNEKEFQYFQNKKLCW